MARRRTFDDASVVVAARDLFWERGYAATSLAQLQEATGLSRSSLYETYGSKRGLFERALRSYLADVLVPMIEPLEASGAGRRELVDYYHALADLVRSAPARMPNRGCLMLTTSVEVDDLNDDASLLAKDYCGRLRSAIRHALEPITSITNPDERADALMANQLGLVAMARLDPETAVRMASGISGEIESW
jgi:TetR/AcrR family transcriptional repressor of nem operon